MMKTKRILNLAAVAAMMAACSNDVPAPAAVDHMSDTPIGFKPGVAQMTTRAGYAAGELTAGELGFYMQTAGTDGLDATTAAKYNGTNRKVECPNGKWAVEGYPLLWRNQSDEVTWQVYYPYTESNVTDGILTITIPADQQNDGVYDLLYGKGTTTGAASADGIDITLKHMFSKLIVNLTISTELDNAEVESVVLNDLTIEGRFNVSNTEQIVIPGNMIDYSEEEVNINMIKANNTTFEAIVLPYNPDILVVEITLVGGRKFYYTRGFTEFKKGHVQTLNLKIGNDKVEAESLNAADWSEPEAGTVPEGFVTE